MKVNIGFIMFIMFLLGMVGLFIHVIISDVDFKREADGMCNELGYDEYEEIGRTSYCLKGKTLTKVLKTCGISACVLYEVNND